MGMDTTMLMRMKQIAGKDTELRFSYITLRIILKRKVETLNSERHASLRQPTQ
jgi:hypothetical protein